VIEHETLKRRSHYISRMACWNGGPTRLLRSCSEHSDGIQACATLNTSSLRPVAMAFSAVRRSFSAQRASKQAFLAPTRSRRSLLLTSACLVRTLFRPSASTACPALPAEWSARAG